MEAEGAGAGGVAEDEPGQASSGDPGHQDGPGGHESRGGHESPGDHEGPGHVGLGRGDSAEADTSDSLGTEIALALLTSSLGADAWPESDGPEESTANRAAGHRLQLYPIYLRSVQGAGRGGSQAPGCRVRTGEGRLGWLEGMGRIRWRRGGQEGVQPGLRGKPPSG